MKRPSTCPSMRLSLLGLFTNIAAISSEPALVHAAASAASCTDPEGIELLQTQALMHRVALTRNSGNTSLEFVSAFGQKPTAAEVAGVTTNDAGDMAPLAVTIGTSVVTIVACYIIHLVARHYVPKMYNHPESIGLVPKWPEGRHGGFFGIIWDSLKLSIDEIQASANLDHAMLIEYTHLAMKLMATIGIPGMFILAPLHAFLGGNRSGYDKLSKQGLANVEDGSWLYWAHGFVVWLVVLIADKYALDAMRGYITRRSRWLKEMPDPQDSTILMEGIPHAYCTDSKLREYFNRSFGRVVVKEACIVKFIGRLERIIARLDIAKLALKKAEEYKARTGETQTVMDRSEHLRGVEVEQVQYYYTLVEKLDKERKEERDRILKAAEAEDPDVHSTSGFITFEDKRDAEIALQMAYTADMAEWMAQTPPDPADVRYHDLQVDPHVQKFRGALGYAAVVGVIVAYLPLILAISNFASLDNVTRMFPFIGELVDESSVCESIWDGLAGSIGLLLVLSFLPSILLFIHAKFFTLKSEQYSQLLMQSSYYYIQVLYVLLVTAIGTSIVSTARGIVESPTSVLELLAGSMPEASHFYLKYMATSWGTHAMIFSRYVQLGKYGLFRMAYTEEDSREMAEPEDQDYYGMGSRSARFSLMLAIGLVYATLSPLMCVLCFINFAVCRIFYGYLFVYCEDRSKPDLGGEFFVKQIQHLLHAVTIYILLMAGVLQARSDSHAPGTIALLSGVVHWLAYSRIYHGLRWEALSLEAINQSANKPDRKASRNTYVQPELCND